MSGTSRPPVERPPEGAPDAPPLWLPDEPFPPYRFVPGHTPHPFAHVEGHSHGQPRAVPALCAPQAWRENRAYLRGVDFFNRGWWWEAHETWEELWHVCEGRDPAQHALLQGLIQLAAAALQREKGADAGAGRLLARALANLQRARELAGADTLCGLDLPAVGADARAHLDHPVERVDGLYLRPR